MARLQVVVLLMFGITALATSFQPRDNAACAQWCAANFPNPGSCTSQAAHGKGPCYVCGPLKTSPTQQLCQGACVETSTDTNNCGSCGIVCSSTSCINGACASSCLPAGATCDTTASDECCSKICDNFICS